MSYIFISYSHKDKDYAHKIEQELKNRGFEVWLDDRIDYGDEWPKIIEKKLNDCDAMLLIMTSSSYNSNWVQRELARSQRRKKKIFPLLLEGEEPWLSVETTQYVDVRDGKLPSKDFYKTLTKIVRRKESNSITRKIKSTDIPEKIHKNQKTSEIFLGIQKNPESFGFPRLSVFITKNQKSDEIVKSLGKLKEKSMFSSNEKFDLKVGRCEIWYERFPNDDSPYYGSIFVKGLDDDGYSFPFRDSDSQSELRKNLRILGWFDYRLGLLRKYDRIFGSKAKNKDTLMKKWEQNTDLVDIAKFLIDTHELLEIEPSEIDVVFKKKLF